MNYQLIALDLDGTLLDSRKNLPESRRYRAAVRTWVWLYPVRKAIYRIRVAAAKLRRSNGKRT